MQTEPLPSHPVDEPDAKHKLPLLPPSDAPVTMLTSPLAPTPQTLSAETRAIAPLPVAPAPLLTKVLPVPLTNLAPPSPWQIKPPPSLHSDTSPLGVFSLEAPAHMLMLPLFPSVFTPLLTANWPLEPLADEPDWTCTQPVCVAAAEPAVPRDTSPLDAAVLLPLNIATDPPALVLLLPPNTSRSPLVPSDDTVASLPMIVTGDELDELNDN
jgi:hypothetical protein